MRAPGLGSSSLVRKKHDIAPMQCKLACRHAHDNLDANVAERGLCLLQMALSWTSVSRLTRYATALLQSSRTLSCR